MALGFLSPTAWVGSRVFDDTQVEAVTCDSDDCGWEGDADVTYPDGNVIGVWRCTGCGETNETERDADGSPDDLDPFDLDL